MRAINDFWCNECRKDWTLECHQTQSWFVAWCPKCRREVRRHRGEREWVLRDPFWVQSEKVKRQRKKYWKDILQPGDPEFDKYYPQYKREREEKLETEERKKHGNST